MKWGWFMGKSRAKDNSLEDSKNLANLLVALSGKWETPALIAYLADERARLLLCKALISPVSGSDRKLAQRAYQILRFRGMDPERLKKRLEPAAFALGLVSVCYVQIDYYDVLGVKSSATPQELRAAYRKKAFELHPDTARQTSEDSTDFVTVKAAYDTLIDPKGRAAFDQCRVQLGSWLEERPGENPGEGAKRRPAGRARKISYRIAAVVVVMVVIAWALSILYERETMLELVQVTSSTEPGPAREMAESDPGEVGNKTPVLPEVVEDKAATKKPAPKKPAPKKPVREKPAREKPAREPLKTAVVAVAEPVEAREAVWAPGPAEEKRPKDVLKPAREKVIEESEPDVSAMVQAQTPTISEDPVPPNSSIHAATDSPVQVFPDIPIPKTHKTPFIKRSQVLAFLKKYTAAYERGNAETFFSYFTANATENGKPLKACKPDYLEIWDKVQTLAYHISVKGTEEVVGSDTVSMKGRFDLDWQFFDGRSGQSHGDIFMDLKLNKGSLRVSRLHYRFDGE